MHELGPTTLGRPTPLDGVTVARIMHAGFLGCPLETPVNAIAKLMAAHHVHSLVGFGDVADGDTRLWGIVSDVDVVTALAEGDGSQTAGEIASTRVVTVGPADSVRHAAELMRDHNVSHLLVMNGVSDRPLGVVSTLDVMALAGGSG